MFEIVDGRRTDGRTDGRTTDDGRTPEHGYTISSPCEPEGSGELKRTKQSGFFSFFFSLILRSTSTLHP